jgi:hypothetical protein
MCEKTLNVNSYPDMVLVGVSAIVVLIAAKYGQKRFKLRPPAPQ